MLYTFCATVALDNLAVLVKANCVILTNFQAQSILEMQLRRLQGLEYEKIEAEYQELLKKIAYFKALLAAVTLCDVSNHHKAVFILHENIMWAGINARSIFTMNTALCNVLHKTCAFRSIFFVDTWGNSINNSFIIMLVHAGYDTSKAAAAFIFITNNFTHGTSPFAQDGSNMT